MTATREWSTLNKSEWGVGPWQREPDKVQWVDEATGLDCLVVRGPSGALIGYVGVPESNPLHGIDYSGCTSTPPCEESWCNHRPESRMEVHGGLTFSGACHEATTEGFEQFRARVPHWEEEAKKHPRGDAAERLAAMGHLRDDFEGWKRHNEATAICHIPLEGRPDNVWWFGFDCAHSGDLCPKYLANPRLSSLTDGVYASLGYVRSQCANLAAQLAASAPLKGDPAK